MSVAKSCCCKIRLCLARPDFLSASHGASTCVTLRRPASLFVLTVVLLGLVGLSVCDKIIMLRGTDSLVLDRGNEGW